MSNRPKQQETGGWTTDQAERKYSLDTASDSITHFSNHFKTACKSDHS